MSYCTVYPTLSTSIACVSAYTYTYSLFISNSVAYGNNFFLSWNKRLTTGQDSQLLWWYKSSQFFGLILGLILSH